MSLQLPELLCSLVCAGCSLSPPKVKLTPPGVTAQNTRWVLGDFTEFWGLTIWSTAPAHPSCHPGPEWESSDPRCETCEDFYKNILVFTSRREKKQKILLHSTEEHRLMHFPYNPCSELKAGRKMALVSFEFSTVSKHSRH